MQSLRNDLKAGKEIRELMKRYEKKKTSNYYQAVMDLIIRANWEQMEEEKKMCEALKELFAEELKESEENGIKAGENQGIALAKSVFRLAANGISTAEIASRCGISEERVQEILE